MKEIYIRIRSYTDLTLIVLHFADLVSSEGLCETV